MVKSGFCQTTLQANLGKQFSHQVFLLEKKTLACKPSIIPTFSASFFVLKTN